MHISLYTNNISLAALTEYILVLICNKSNQIFYWRSQKKSDFFRYFFRNFNIVVLVIRFVGKQIAFGGGGVF